MKGFFEDHEIRKYTFKEKILLILNKLIQLSNPIITGYESHIHVCYGAHGKLKTVRAKIPIVNFAAGSLELLESDIGKISPFRDIYVEFTEDIIQVKGEDFQYSFPPTMLPELQQRFKRV